FGNKDVAIWRNEHVVRLEEEFRIAAAAGLTEGQKQLTVGTEFEDLMTFGSRRRRCIPSRAAGTRAICYPDISVAVDEDARRGEQQAGTKTLDQLAALVEVQDRVEHGILAGVGATSLSNPNRFPILVDFDGAGRAPSSALRQLRPIRYCLIRIRTRIGRLHIRLSPSRKSEQAYKERQTHDSDCHVRLICGATECLGLASLLCQRLYTGIVALGGRDTSRLYRCCPSSQS